MVGGGGAEVAADDDNPKNSGARSTEVRGDEVVDGAIAFLRLIFDADVVAGDVIESFSMLSFNRCTCSDRNGNFTDHMLRMADQIGIAIRNFRWRCGQFR